MDLRPARGGVALRVRVQPGAAQDALAGVREGALLVRIAAPPVEGKANAALLRFLADALGVSPRSLSLRHGRRGRDKLLLIEGGDLERLRARLESLVGRP